MYLTCSVTVGVRVTGEGGWEVEPPAKFSTPVNFYIQPLGKVD